MPINKTPVNIKQKEFVLTAPKYSFENVVLPRNVEDEIELALGMYENAYEVYVEWGG